MRFLKILAVVLWTLLPVRAEASAFNAETFTLNNGLQVVVIPNHRAPVVTQMIWYKFGGADERPGKSGIAHFLEHLMFKGTPRVPDGQFSITVKKLGGNDNAFTTHDYTAFYQNIAKEHLPRVMEMEADRMKNLELREDQVGSEREVIIEERHQRIDNQPEARFQEQLMSALFVNHPYGTPVIGWLHEMKTLTRADAMEEYTRWYAPNNAVLVVSGDVTAEELKPLAEKYYGVLPASVLSKRERPLPAPITADHRLTMSDPRVGLPVVTKIYRAPRGSDALEMLAEVFGGSSTARLYKDLVVDQKIAVAAGADYDPVSLNDTTLSLFATPAPGVSVEKLEAALQAEVQKLLKDGVTATELQGAKNRKKASLTYALDGLQGPAMLFGRAIASGFDVNYVETLAERAQKLQPDDINKAAAAQFAADNIPVTGILLPQEKKK